MLDNTFETAAPVMQAATATLSNVVSGSFLPSMSSLRDSVNWGIEKGTSDLARIGVVVGGVIVVGATTYGVYKGVEYLSEKSGQAARHMRDKAASWTTPKEGTVPEAEVVPPTAAAA